MSWMKSFMLGLLLATLGACSAHHTNAKPNEMLTESRQPDLAKAAKLNVEMGITYLQKNNVARAKQKLLLALKQAPQWAPAHEAMGYFLEQTGEAKKAESYYKKAISIAPRSGQARNNYGTYLCRMGRFQQAEHQLLLAAQNLNYVNNSEAYENAGLCAMQIPNDAKAISYFKKAIEQNPSRPTSLLELSELNYKTAHYQEADDYLKRYFKLAKQGPQSLWLAVRLEGKLGNKQRAQDFGLRLENNFPKSREAALWQKSQHS